MDRHTVDRASRFHRTTGHRRGDAWSLVRLTEGVSECDHQHLTTETRAALASFNECHCACQIDTVVEKTTAALGSVAVVVDEGAIRARGRRAHSDACGMLYRTRYDRGRCASRRTDEAMHTLVWYIASVIAEVIARCKEEFGCAVASVDICLGRFDEVVEGVVGILRRSEEAEVNVFFSGMKTDGKQSGTDVGVTRCVTARKRGSGFVLVLCGDGDLYQVGETRGVGFLTFDSASTSWLLSRKTVMRLST